MDKASSKRIKATNFALFIGDDKVSNGGLFEPGQKLFLDP